MPRSDRQVSFSLGQVVSTPSALKRLTHDDIQTGLQRHAAGDWGDVDKHDWQANERALRDGSRLFSVYHAHDGTKFWIIIVLLSIVLGTLSVLARLFDSSNNLSHRVSSLWGRWLCRLNGIQVDIEGLEHIRQDQAQIFIANHQGFFDIFALNGFMPVQIRLVFLLIKWICLHTNRDQYH